VLRKTDWDTPTTLRVCFSRTRPPLVSTRRADSPVRCVRPHDAGQPSDRGARVGPTGALAIIWRSANGVPREKMYRAHDCDRPSRGWFSSQIWQLLRANAFPVSVTVAFRIRVRSWLPLFPTSTLILERFGQKPSISAYFRIANLYSLQRYLGHLLTFLSPRLRSQKRVVENFQIVAYSRPPRSFLPLSQFILVGIPTTSPSVFFLFYFPAYPLLTRESPASRGLVPVPNNSEEGSCVRLGSLFCSRSHSCS